MDRTSVRDLIRDIADITDTLPDRCCAKCAHGEPLADPVTGRQMIECTYGPPTPLLIPMSGPMGQGIGIKCVWPVVEKTRKCGRFEPIDEA